MGELDGGLLRAEIVANPFLAASAEGGIQAGANRVIAADRMDDRPAPGAMRADRPRAGSVHDYVRALRVHQWLKNLLVFTPTLAAHDMGAGLVAAAVAFVSFSLCASGVYVLNDLLDLPHDRAHPRKRFRPLASGAIPIAHGVALIPLLVGSALGLACLLPWPFLGVLCGYLALTSAYSLVLKRQMLVDVVTLACLYGARLLAGGAACGIQLSPWLAALALFLFLCLALVKRCSELAGTDGDPSGRGYRIADLPMLQAMAAASGYVTVLVLALYINSDAVRALYRHPDPLWLTCVLLLYWVSRTLLLTHRGEMHDDPVVFAATDPASQGVGIACLAVVSLAL